MTTDGKFQNAPAAPSQKPAPNAVITLSSLAPQLIKKYKSRKPLRRQTVRKPTA